MIFFIINIHAQDEQDESVLREKPAPAMLACGIADAMPRLTDYRALTFDCYGTLIDWETGIWEALQPLILHNPESDLSRETALGGFGRWESRQQQATPELPYPELLARVHRSIAQNFGLESNRDLDVAFGASVPCWPAFPDSADGLRLPGRYYKLAILSNVDRGGIAASMRKLGVEFDAVYTAEDIGSYKPADANFTYLLDHLKSDFGLERSEVLHVAQSLYHDHAPANRFGIASAWIDRQRLSQGGSWGATEPMESIPSVDFVYFSLREMAEAVAAEGGSWSVVSG